MKYTTARERGRAEFWPIKSKQARRTFSPAPRPQNPQQRQVMPRYTPTSGSRARDTRSRSRSPYREAHHRSHHHSRRPRSRSRSPYQAHDSRRHKRQRSPSPTPRPVVLPYNASRLSKSQFEEYKPLFQSYLDIQKHIHLDELDEREVRGRWKSFVGRWNRGDLARSWYDASMLKTAKETVASHRRESPARKPDARWEAGEPSRKAEEDGPDSDRDEFGPSLPEDISPRRTGPTIPRFDDLALRNELQEEDRARDRAQYVDEIRHERNLDRKAQKERLEELVPRADPGARERQLEKKRETTNTLKDFRDAKEGGDVEIGEADLMGDDGIDAYKKRKVEMERKKNEREIRREEIMRARAAERDERLADRRTKEANTMEYLKALAKERFG